MRGKSYALIAPNRGRFVHPTICAARAAEVIQKYSDDECQYPFRATHVYEYLSGRRIGARGAQGTTRQRILLFAVVSPTTIDESNFVIYVLLAVAPRSHRGACNDNYLLPATHTRIPWNLYQFIARGSIYGGLKE